MQLFATAVTYSEARSARCRAVDRQGRCPEDASNVRFGDNFKSKQSGQQANKRTTEWIPATNSPGQGTAVLIAMFVCPGW